VLLIWALTGVLLYEAVDRILNPEVVDGRTMFIVACLGLFVNICMGTILHGPGHHGGGAHSHSHSHSPQPHSHSHIQSETSEELTHPVEENINVRAAFIHVVGDLVQSVGVMIAGGLIWYNPEWKLADPITTFIFSILVMITTVKLVKDSVLILMEGMSNRAFNEDRILFETGVPTGINSDELMQDLQALQGVMAVHDLHIWLLSTTVPALSVHLVTKDNSDSTMLTTVQELARKKYNIEHTTIQIERPVDEVRCMDEHYH
jgi:zinc transporter 2